MGSVNQQASRPSPVSDRIARMSLWIRDHSERPWIYPTDPEVVLYVIECRYPGGVAAFDREVRR